jgi:hypothetical protein
MDWGDSAGDGDGFLEPGERTDLVMTVRNASRGAAAKGVIVSVTSADARIRISQNRAFIGDFSPGGASSNRDRPFLVEMDTSFPEDASAEFLVTFADEHGYAEQRAILVSPPGMESRLWEREIYDPFWDLYLWEPVAAPGRDGSVHVLFMAYGDRGPFFRYVHWTGGLSTIDDDIYPSVPDWKWGHDLSLDGRGLPHATWVEARDEPEGWGAYTTGIYYSERDAAWAPARALNDAFSSEHIYRALTAGDELGRIHVLWLRPEGYGGPLLVFHAIRDGEDWSEPRLVRNLNGNEVGDTMYMDLAPTGGGKIALVWAGGDNHALYYMEYARDVWSNVFQIPVEGRYVGAVDLEVDEVGVWHVGFGDYAAQERCYTNSSQGWSPIHVLRSGVPRGSGPKVAIGPDGTVHLLYNEDEDCFYRTYRDGTLSPEEHVITLNGFFRNLDFTVDTVGNVHFFWLGWEPGDINSANHKMIRAGTGDAGEGPRILLR